MAWPSKWKAVAIIAVTVIAIAWAVIAWNAAANRRVDKLVADLGSDDYAVRCRAEDALGASKSRHDIKRIIWHLGDNESKDRADEFALVLALIGKDAVEPLNSMTISNRSVRWYNKYPVPLLVKGFLWDYIEKQDERDRNFNEVDWGMYRYLGNPAEERLIEMVKSNEDAYQYVASVGLGALASADTLPAVLDLMPSNSQQAAYWVAWEAIEQISLGSSSEPITNLTPAEVETLAGFLTSKNAAMRRAAATLLGRCDKAAAADKLAGLLTSDSPATRDLGATGLSIRGDKRALPVLLEEARNYDIWYPGFSLGVLGRYDDPEAVALLTKAFDDPTWGGAVTIGSSDIHFAPGTGWDERQAALAAANAQRYEGIRHSAVWGLAQVVSRKGTDEAARESADKALSEALSGADDAKREAAIQALAEVKDSRALEALKRQLREGDAGACVRAVSLLANYDTPDARAAIEGALEDSQTRVRSAAVSVLGRSRDSAAQEALIKALGDSDAGVRNQAAEALLHRKCLDAARRNGARIPEEW